MTQKSQPQKKAPAKKSAAKNASSPAAQAQTDAEAFRKTYESIKAVTAKSSKDITAVEAEHRDARRSEVHRCGEFVLERLL